MRMQEHVGTSFLSGECGLGCNSKFYQSPFLVLSIPAVFPGELMLDVVPFRNVFRERLCSVENKKKSFFSILECNRKGRKKTMF